MAYRRTNLLNIGTGAPTDADIARETDRLAKLNKLDEGSRNRDLIYPGEIIKLTSNAVALGFRAILQIHYVSHARVSILSCL
ncbi:MAG: hypothetical protein IPO31_15080 [Candidatus Obscuribacter sp.]|nr:hypothetical protein [Candidatus Obscuribacter sp.]